MSIEQQRRKAIEAQIAALHRKAIEARMPDDPAGMVGFLSVLLAAQMQVCLLKADFEQAKTEREANGE